MYVMRRRLFAVSLNDRKSLNVNGAMQLEVFASDLLSTTRDNIFEFLYFISVRINLYVAHMESIRVLGILIYL